MCHCKGDVKPQVRGKLQHLSPLTSPLILTKCTKRVSSILIHLMCISPLCAIQPNDSNLVERWKQVSARKQIFSSSSVFLSRRGSNTMCTVVTRGYMKTLSYLSSYVLCVVLASMQLHLFSIFSEIGAAVVVGYRRERVVCFFTRIQSLEIRKDTINWVVLWFAKHVLLFVNLILLHSSKNLELCIAVMQHSCGLYFRLFDICMCVCSLFNAELHIF